MGVVEERCVWIADQPCVGWICPCDLVRRGGPVGGVGYSLDFGRTPELRELDYVRQTAASVDSAKVVEIFGLNRFLADRYRELSQSF